MEEAQNTREEANYTAIFNAVNDAILVQDIETARILDANQKSCEMFCYPREEMLALTAYALMADEEPYTREEAARLLNLAASGEPQIFEWLVKDKAGRVFWVEVNLKRAVLGGKYRLLALVRDITERKDAEEAFLRRDYQLGILSRTSQHINMILETPIIMRTLVAAAMEVVGATGGMAGLIAEGKMRFTEYNKEGNLQAIDYAFEPGHGVAGWVINTLKPYISNDTGRDGHVIAEVRDNFELYNIVNVPVISRSGGLLGCIEIHNKKEGSPFDDQDVFMLQGMAASAAVALENTKMLVEQRQAEQALKEKERFMTSIFTSIQDGISILDKEMNIVRVNPIMEEWYAHAMPLVGKKCYEAYHMRTERCDPCPTHHTLTRGKAAHEVVPKRGPKGEIIGWLDLFSFPMTDAETDEPTGVIEYVRDITERRRAEIELETANKEITKTNEKLKQMSVRDIQTGLYNHLYLIDALELELQRAKRYANSLSMLMLDIDYFKSINDVYGHEFGDLVIKQFAKHLKKAVRRADTVVRFGGEEFVIISPNADRQRATVLGQRLLDDVGLYDFGDKEHIVKLKLSIAVSSYPDDNIAKGADFVDYADKILNKAKEDGGNRVYSFLDLRKEKPAAALKAAAEAPDIKFLKERLVRLTKQGKQSLIESISAFAKTIELKDHYTGQHVENTVRYSMGIAKAFNLSAEEIDNIKQASVLHDLGKIGINDKILLKKSKLTKKEFEEIKRHPQIAADIIRPIQFMHDIIPLVLYHHERWDGKGYPAGLRGEEIPLGARIIAIADVYQALTSDRPYRKAFSKKDAINIIKTGAGTQFDPRVVEVFLNLLKKED